MIQGRSTMPSPRVSPLGGGEVYFPSRRRTSRRATSSPTCPAPTPKGLVLRGVPHSTTLKPSAAVTVCLTIAGDQNNNGSVNRVTVSGLDFDGSNTTGATGLLIGDNSINLSGVNVIRDVQILHFQGTGGKGLYIKNAVDCHYWNVYVGRNDTNVYSSGDTVQGLPTLQTFNYCQFREATTKGVNIVTGYQITFNDCLFEANGQEGLYICPTSIAQNCLNINVNGGWIEDNYNSVGNVQVRADGSLGGGTITVQMRRVLFNASHQSLYFKNVGNLILDNISPINQAGDVTIDTGCNGFITNWNHNNAPIATVLVNNSGAAVSTLEAKAWNKLAWDANGNLSPTSGFGFNLGDATFRFGKVFCETIVPYMSQPPYGAIVTPDAGAGRTAQIIATNANNFQIAAPTNGSWGSRLTVQVLNSSGGAMGSVGFGGGIKQSGFVSPASTKHTSADFVYDGTNWIQVTPWTPDV
jgi:hypothetical protein